MSNIMLICNIHTAVSAKVFDRSWQHPGNVCSIFRFVFEPRAVEFCHPTTRSRALFPFKADLLFLDGAFNPWLWYKGLACNSCKLAAARFQWPSSFARIMFHKCPGIHAFSHHVLRVSVEASGCNHPHRGHLPERQHSLHPFHPPEGQVIQKPLICKRRCGRPSSRPEHWNGSTPGRPWHNLGITARSFLQHATASVPILWQEKAPPVVWRQEERFWDLKQLVASAINFVQRLYLQTMERLRCQEISSFYDGESGYVYLLPGLSIHLLSRLNFSSMQPIIFGHKQSDLLQVRMFWHHVLSFARMRVFSHLLHLLRNC